MRNARLQLRPLAPLVVAGVLAAPALPGPVASPSALAAEEVRIQRALAAQEESATREPPRARDETGGSVEPHPEAVEAVTRLKSPFCPGFMLEVCPSPQAAVLRDTIETLARTGMESEEIVEWVLARYGEEWRALPKTEGKGLVAWLGPPVAILLGVGVVVLVLVKIRRDGDDTDVGAAGAPELSDADEQRLARAVRAFDAE